MKLQWINLVRKLKDKPNWTPWANSRVCSRHFLENDFVPNHKKKILKPDAVPSINLCTYFISYNNCDVLFQIPITNDNFKRR